MTMTPPAAPFGTQPRSHGNLDLSFYQQANCTALCLGSKLALLQPGVGSRGKQHIDTQQQVQPDCMIAGQPLTFICCGAALPGPGLWAPAGYGSAPLDAFNVASLASAVAALASVVDLSSSSTARSQQHMDQPAMHPVPVNF
ncbi:MAG: hypothetical protein FRX49_13083 [Trebouxia sp. A1-2]|nr:MAG: hypothetical protein FRX49_13083 [Trebouxia sp. A1-2]